MFEPLADSASTDELPSSSDVDDLSKSFCAEVEAAHICTRSVFARCDCGY